MMEKVFAKQMQNIREDSLEKDCKPPQNLVIY